MPPYRLFVAALLFLALAGAGCTSRAPAPEDAAPPPDGLVPVGGGPAEGNETAKARPSPATMNLTRDPVDIQDGGDLMNGASKDWAWHVAPGFRTFEVSLRLEGPQGVPTFAVLDLSYRLAGGDPAKTHAESQGGVWIGSSACFACLDGATLPAAAGEWELHFSTGPSAGRYSVHVVVTY